MATDNHHPAVIEAEAEAEFSDEGYETSIGHSYVTSLASDIRRGVEENGRIYPSRDRSHMTYTPMDDAEVEL